MANIAGQHFCCSDCANFIANGDSSSLDLYGPEYRSTWELGIVSASADLPNGQPIVEFGPAVASPTEFLCDYCGRMAWSLKYRLDFAPDAASEGHVSTTVIIDGKEVDYSTFGPGLELDRERHEEAMQIVGINVPAADIRIVTQFHNHAEPENPDDRDVCDCEITYAPSIWTNEPPAVGALVRFTIADGPLRSGYITRILDDGTLRVCTEPGTYFSVHPDEAEVVPGPVKARR